MAEPMDVEDRSELLESLERGQLQVDQVLHALEARAPVPPLRSRRSSTPAIRRWWWLLIALPGVLMVLAGASLVRFEGWWLLPAIALLLLGGLLFAMGIMSIRSPWIRLRSSSPEAAPLRLFGFHLPLRPAAWLARLLGKRTAIFEGTVLDELLLGLEGASDGGLSFSIDIEDRESGQRIQVSID